jgi:hypothetical protein
MAIRQPFGLGEDPVLQAWGTVTKVAAASTAAKRTITANNSFLRIATATKGKTIKFFAGDNLPAGAVVYVSAQSASSELLLGSGFAGARAFINSKTAGKGTGSWDCAFVYNGTDFRHVGRPVTAGRKLIF